MGINTMNNKLVSFQKINVVFISEFVANYISIKIKHELTCYTYVILNQEHGNKMRSSFREHKLTNTSSHIFTNQSTRSIESKIDAGSTWMRDRPLLVCQV